MSISGTAICEFVYAFPCAQIGRYSCDMRILLLLSNTLNTLIHTSLRTAIHHYGSSFLGEERGYSEANPGG
jgi:hypothetical protein